MPHQKPDLESKRPEDSAEVGVLLAQIEGEEIPERLLTLARELQRALNLRKKQVVSGDDA
jgi:hypothetical protein